MKNLIQAAGLMATLLLFATGCELIEKENEPIYRRIVPVGNLIQSAKILTFSGYFPIASDPDNKNAPIISTVVVNFELQNVQFYGFDQNDNRCSFNRDLQPEESFELLKRLSELTFCEFQTNEKKDCILCSLPGNYFYVDTHFKSLYVDQESFECLSPVTKLCQSKDFLTITDFIAPRAKAELYNCQHLPKPLITEKKLLLRSPLSGDFMKSRFYF